MTIPIRNLYYLFCYAWRRFPPAGMVENGIDDSPDIPNLFGRMLSNGLNRLLRRGLDRGYREYVEYTRSPRGRLLLDTMVKEQTLRRGAAVCSYDNLTHDVLHNRILKATAVRLAAARGLESEIARDLAQTIRRMEGVSDISLAAGVFRQVQLSRQTGEYAPLLKLCEFVCKSLLPQEGAAGGRFSDILRDEVVMSAVFEEFLRGFYEHEQNAYRVAVETLSWSGSAENCPDWNHLPRMVTDITLLAPRRSVVIDAKFYHEALAERFGARKVHSQNLYQLFSYLHHTRAKRPDDEVEGILIYPANGYSVSLQYTLSGYPVRVLTVDLALRWPEIHRQLLDIIGVGAIRPPVARAAGPKCPPHGAGPAPAGSWSASSAIAPPSHRMPSHAEAPSPALTRQFTRP